MKPHNFPIRSFSMNLATVASGANPVLRLTPAVTVFAVPDGTDADLHAILYFWAKKKHVTAPTFAHGQWIVHFHLAALAGVTAALAGREPKFVAKTVNKIPVVYIRTSVANL